MKKNLKTIGYWGSIVSLGVILGISLQFAKAWTEPSTTPPNANLGAPINTGASVQNKTGSLGTSGSFSAAGAVQGKTVKGTSQLCIGNDCRSAWPSGGGTGGWSGSGSGTAGRVTKWTASNKIGNSIIYDTGSAIGIAQASPKSRLDVNGGIRGTSIYSTGNITAVGNIVTSLGTVSGNKVNAAASIYSAGTIKAATTVSGTTVSGTTVKGTTVCIGKVCRTTWPSTTPTPVASGRYGHCVAESFNAFGGGGSYSHKVTSYKYPAKPKEKISGQNYYCTCESGYTLIGTGSSGNLSQINGTLTNFYTCIKN